MRFRRRFAETYAYGCSIREYRVIQERFNKMIDQVSELRNIALERLIQINRITLQYYERQIRPHFFLNCLKNIFGMSTTEDKEKIQEYILVLSNYLRFAFQNHRPLIPLKEELQGVDDYIRLQQMTMQNPIQYYEEIESGWRSFRFHPFNLDICRKFLSGTCIQRNEFRRFGFIFAG